MGTLRGQPHHPYAGTPHPPATHPTLPPTYGPTYPPPTTHTTRTPRRPRPRRSDPNWGPDGQFRIPPPSHVPSLNAVARAAKPVAVRLALCVSALCLLATGILGWDLWGSAWYADRQQAALLATLEATPATPAIPAVAPPEPAPPQPPAPQLLIDTATLTDGEAFGRITIDKIGVDQALVYGTDVPALKKGPGVWKWGVTPGHPGNAMISGHRTTYGAPFHDIHLLEPGDRITIQIPGEADAVFEVRQTSVVLPQNIEVSDQTDGVRLTMTACDPIGSAAHRIVVQSELVEGTYAQYALPADQWTFQGPTTL